MAIPLTREKGIEAFVDSICVLPDHQHQGVGKQLWDKLTQQAKDNGYAAIRLLTNPRLNSYKWYKEMGFRESGWIEVFKELS